MSDGVAAGDSRPRSTPPTLGSRGPFAPARRLGTKPGRLLFVSTARRVLAALLCLGLGACELATIEPYGTRDGGGPTEEDPEDFFDANVQPLMDEHCDGCHLPGGSSMRPFMDTGSDYDRVLAHTRADGSPIVVAGEPDMSPFYDLLLIGDHPFDAWPDGAPAVRNWILLEGMMDPIEVDAGPEQMPLRTGRVIPVDGEPGSITLDSIGAPGAALTFTASFNGTRLTLTDVALEAGSVDVSITTPKLYVWDGMMETLAHEFTESANYRATPSSPAPLASTVAVGEFPAGYELQLEVGSISTM